MKCRKLSVVYPAIALLLVACGGGGSSPDGLDTSMTTGVASGITQENNNLAPSISGVPSSLVIQDNAYQFTPTASSPNNAPLVFEISNQPAWLNFNTSTGNLSGTPTSGDVGIFQNIGISVTDGISTSFLSPFTIVVKTFVPLQVTGTPSLVAQENSAYIFAPIVENISGTLQFSIINKPSWLTLDADSGNLYGIPREADIGTYGDIHIIATDDLSEVRLNSFSLAVISRLTQGNGNLAPLINGEPPSLITQNSVYQFTPTASDPDNDPLIFEISNQPAWLNFNTSTGNLSGTPASGDVGVFQNISISVTDGNSTSFLPPFTITVEGFVPLQVTGTPSLIARENSTYSFTPSAENISGALQFSIINKPAWLTFDPDSGNLYGIPREADIGIYENIQISATDDASGAALASFTLTVAPSVPSATLSWVAPTTRVDNSVISLSELKGFKIYSGTEANNLQLLTNIEDPTITTYVVNDLPPATYFFAVTVYDQSMIESDFSEIATKTIN